MTDEPTTDTTETDTTETENRIQPPAEQPTHPDLHELGVRVEYAEEYGMVLIPEFAPSRLTERQERAINALTETYRVHLGAIYLGHPGPLNTAAQVVEHGETLTIGTLVRRMDELNIMKSEQFSKALSAMKEALKPLIQQFADALKSAIKAFKPLAKALAEQQQRQREAQERAERQRRSADLPQTREFLENMDLPPLPENLDISSLRVSGVPTEDCHLCDGTGEMPLTEAEEEFVRCRCMSRQRRI